MPLLEGSVNASSCLLDRSEPAADMEPMFSVHPAICSWLFACVQGDILEDIALIENLEETKRTALDIAEKVKQAKETEVSISKAREVYRQAHHQADSQQRSCRLQNSVSTLVSMSAKWKPHCSTQLPVESGEFVTLQLCAAILQTSRACAAALTSLLQMLTLLLCPLQACRHTWLSGLLPH